MTEVPLSVWLVGLSGSGKSTVGPLLADRLGYDFVDLDTKVESLAGEPIADVFRRAGESEFRRLEAEATADLVDRKRVVVACGGGWMARRDIERSGPGRVRLWLRVRPETAIHRLADDQIAVRPLLAGRDPTAALATLLQERESAYAEAEVVLDTDDRTPIDVVEAAVVGLETTRGSWGASATEDAARHTSEQEAGNRSL